MEVTKGAFIMDPTEEEDRLCTQMFMMGDILIRHCGETLTPEKIDQMMLEMQQEVTGGVCSWAFRR